MEKFWQVTSLLFYTLHLLIKGNSQYPSQESDSLVVRNWISKQSGNGITCWYKGDKKLSQGNHKNRLEGD